jgi:predicted TIM-barrel fold metal-dependent hydrolase
MASSRRTFLLGALAVALAPRPAAAAIYTGPLIDAHSHVPSATAIDAYAEAMKRHDVARVVLLGVGGVQKEDPAWIAAAARRHPGRVLTGVPVPDPLTADAAERLDAALKGAPAVAVGEVHVRQVSRKIARNPADAVFVRLLGVAARHGLPVVIHQELDAAASAELERALAAERKATIVLAHAGSAAPTTLDGLLDRHANLAVDLSGMHFQRKPALAAETGPLDPAWKALLERRPDRFLMGVDVWAPRLFEPPMLDRLLRWTRRVLGELRPDAAERVAHRNAAALLRLA